MNKIITGLMLLLAILFSTPAQAHYPWINLTDYSPDPGTELHMTLGWGHRYPFAGFLKQDAVEKLEVKGPEKVELAFSSELEIKSNTISAPGAYIIGATRKPGFYTKTVRGGKRTSKENLTHVIKCAFSHMCMKAVVNSGDAAGPVDTALGHPLEIIPLKNPAGLRQGDYLPIKVLHNGKPFKGDLFATYAGFSTEKSTFAYATRTDKKGQAKIRILTPGIWLVKAGHEQPYPDDAICDVESYIATLTFEVK